MKSAGSSQEKLNTLASEVLDLSRNRLLMNLRYMDTALTFHEREIRSGSISVDGKALYFDPEYVLRLYSESKEKLTRTYLHSVLHCVFLHPFIGEGVDARLWNLACDIAVESVISELAIPCVRTDDDGAVSDAAKRIRRECGYLTAEKIYSALRKESPGIADTEDRLKEVEDLFQRDDHAPWYDEKHAATDPQDTAPGPVMMQTGGDDRAEEWKKAAEHIEMELETFAKVKGRYASALVQNLRAVNRERYDYSEFLRKFSAINETMKVSDEEFDYIYYNYGLTHYRRMPLIEPLEYREDRRIHDFVIAIDTSGSVAGEEVQSFLQKTYNILRSRESFDSKINVHIVQCDARVRSDFVIKSPDDFDRYIGAMEIRGLGGTDFRPVFDYVDRLKADGEFSDLKGLIYFTDGLGTYPASKPDYKTAFVFIEKGYNIPEVPVWAMKVIIDEYQ